IPDPLVGFQVFQFLGDFTHIFSPRAGCWSGQIDYGFTVTDKAGFYNGHRYIPATYIDDGAISCVCGHSSECYGITQGWRKGAAGNLTLGIEAWNFHFLVAAQYAALGHHQTHQALFYTFSALKLKRLTAYKCALLRLPRHRPGKIGLQGRHTLVHIA